MLLHDKKVADFVRDFVYEGKSIASICHGTRVLINNGMVKAKTISTWPSMKREVVNSGAKWIDDEIVTHKGFITTRCPNDNPKFNKKMIEEFAIAPKVKLSLLN